MLINRNEIPLDNYTSPETDETKNTLADTSLEALPSNLRDAAARAGWRQKPPARR
ncbi:MAG: hypothetical protein NT121_06070 [Chloroflexi bacterium]|nr:hypothetical protein [Chloroflexota bacterium]